MKLASKTDIAWAAGLFEGEGCITMTGKNPRMQLNTTDEDVLDRFYSIVQLGTMRGPHRNGRYKPYWYWTASGGEYTQTLLGMFWPYLGTRRKARAKEILHIWCNSPRPLASINRDKLLCMNGHSLKKRGKRRHCPTCENAARRKVDGRGPYKPETRARYYASSNSRRMK